MAANRIESTPRQDKATAAAPAEATAPAPAAGGFKSWLPLAVTVVVMPLLAYGMTEFVLLPQLKKGLGISASGSGGAKPKESKESPDAKRESLPMNKLL